MSSQANKRANEIATTTTTTASNGNKRFKVPVEVRCPLTEKLIKDAVIAPDGQVYERDAIETYLGIFGTSPLTNEDMDAADLQPMDLVTESAQDFKNAQDPKKGKWDPTADADLDGMQLNKLMALPDVVLTYNTAKELPPTLVSLLTNPPDPCNDKVFVQMPFGEAQEHARRLLHDGVTVFPFLTNDMLAMINSRFAFENSNVRVFKPTARDPEKLVGGSVYFSNHAETVHGLAARACRLLYGIVMHNILNEMLFHIESYDTIHESLPAALHDMTPQQILDMQMYVLLERTMWRPNKAEIAGETAHRDLTPMKETNGIKGNRREIIFGGWVTLGDPDKSTPQKFTCMKGSHFAYDPATPKKHGFARDSSVATKDCTDVVSVPPGHMVVFWQHIMHVVTPTRGGDASGLPHTRVFLASVLTDGDNGPIMKNVGRILDFGEAPPNKSGQVFQMVPAAYTLYPKLRPHLDAFTSRLQLAYVTTRVIKSNNAREGGAISVPAPFPSMAEIYGKMPFAYTPAERMWYFARTLCD